MSAPLDVIAQHAQNSGDRVAVIVDESGGARPSTTTFAELNRLVNRLANGLLAAGAQPGERLLRVECHRADHGRTGFRLAVRGLVRRSLDAGTTGGGGQALSQCADVLASFGRRQRHRSGHPLQSLACGRSSGMRLPTGIPRARSQCNTCEMRMVTR